LRCRRKSKSSKTTLCFEKLDTPCFGLKNFETHSLGFVQTVTQYLGVCKKSLTWTPSIEKWGIPPLALETFLLLANSLNYLAPEIKYAILE